jgi:hypothetical protein
VELACRWRNCGYWKLLTHAFVALCFYTTNALGLTRLHFDTTSPFQLDVVDFNSYTQEQRGINYRSLASDLLQSNQELLCGCWRLHLTIQNDLEWSACHRCYA